MELGLGLIVMVGLIVIVVVGWIVRPFRQDERNHRTSSQHAGIVYSSCACRPINGLLLLLWVEITV